MLLLALFACEADDTAADSAGPPYGMPLAEDGVLYAGIARIDATPTDFETYSDLNGNHMFDGCVEDPAAERPGCDEPFDDANGNSYFDAAYIAGFGDLRAAQGVHDAITITALVIALDGEYVAIVGDDALGVLENRTQDAKALLEADGFDSDRIVMSSSHSHQAMDTVGIWGDVEKLIPGVYTPYTEAFAENVRDAVQVAASGMVPVSPTVGVTMMSEDPTLNGAPFGGTNPDDEEVGGLSDIRDPIIPGDQILAIALDATADGSRLATLVNASGHPETVGSDNDQLSADYVYYVRDWIETHDGGTALFVSGALGGMQSALDSTLPEVDEAGNRVTDDQGAQVYDTTNYEGFEFAREWGTLVAQAAESALTDMQAWDQVSIAHEDILIPVDNVDFKLAFSVGLLDTPDSYVVQDSSCPGYTGYGDVFGCVPLAVYELRLGPVTFGSVPGELFPELFWGVPDDPAMEDASLRQGDKRWVQVDPDCATIDWTTQCKDATLVNSTCTDEGCDGECDCLHSHVAPYVLDDDDATPIVDLLPGTYKAPMGITNGYCGYIVPGPDFNTKASQLSEDGDHYEETNSCSKSFGPTVLAAFHTVTGN